MDAIAAEIRWKLADLWPQDEVMYFYLCPDCGQAVDGRDLDAIFYHDRLGHAPLPLH